MWSDAIAKRLTRVTTSGRYIAEIDGLRFVAIMSVVVFHVWAYLAHAYYEGSDAGTATIVGQLAARGYYGVQLFFVISGFILALPFAGHYLAGKRPVKLKSYFVRRVTRLEPPYMINLLLCYFLLAADGDQGLLDLLPNLLASLLYQHGLLYGEPSVLNHVAWSLEIEVQFYVLVPLLTQVFRIQSNGLRRGVLIAAGVAVIAINQWTGSISNIEGLHLGRYLHLFLVGFLLADVYVVDWQGQPTPSKRADWVGIAAWVLFTWAVLEDKPWTPYLTTALIFPAYVGAFRGPWLKRAFSIRWVSIIGGMCYTIYLYHIMVGAALVRMFADLGAGQSFEMHLLIQCCVHIPVVLIASGVFFALFERPFMTVWWGRKKTPDPTTA